jgi:serpin B
MHLFNWILLLFILLSSCSNDVNELSDDDSPELRALSSEEKSLSNSSNAFVIDLFKELEKTEEGNLFFSPLSIQYALSMTLNGSKDETFNSIKEVLAVSDLNEHEINEAFKSLTEFLLNVDDKVLLTIANSIWFEQKLTATEAFKKAMQVYYNAEVSGLDFKSPQSVNTINNWVETKTNGLIDKLINEIPDNAVMYLVNAIYYKALWRYPFDEANTQKAPFYPEDNKEIEVMMMHSEEMAVDYYLNEITHVIDIPYGNGQYSMMVLLPVEGKKTEDILEVLDKNTLKNWNNSIRPMEAELFMPKYKIEYKALLNETLSDMGMEIAFTDRADFTRLFEEEYGLMISKVIHKAVIEVNEEGTEAAAVTGVEVSLTSMPPEKPVLTLNRPFIFFIKEKHTGAILFAGKLSNPE